MRSTLVLLAALCVSLPLAGCNSVLRDETPREREDRKLTKAMAAPDLLIYRGLKVSLRGLPTKVGESALGEETKKLGAFVEHLFAQLHPKHGTEGAVEASASYEPLAGSDYLGVGRELYDLRTIVRETDEDAYPTLLHTIMGEQGPARAGMPWYDSTHEHMIFVLTWLTVAQVPRGFRVYEANEIDPSELSEPGLRLAAHLLRGTTYMHERWPLHCIDELDAYLKLLEDERGEILPWLAESYVAEAGARAGFGDEELHAAAHAPGMLVRGMCRIKADQKHEGLDDFEAFLSDAAKIGLDGEAVWLVGAYVGLGREDGEAALENLHKLADSDLIGASEARLIADAIRALEDRDGEAAERSLAEGLLIAKVVGAYISRELNAHDWRRKLGETEGGRKLLHLIELMAQEVESVKAKLTPEKVEELGSSALAMEKKLERKAGCGAS